MHVAELQSKPAPMPKSADTGHAFVPATSRVMTLAEAAAMTEQLRQSEQAVNQEVMCCQHSALAALGLVSMMLHYAIVKIVLLVGLTGMHKTGCCGEKRLVLHVPSSS